MSLIQEALRKAKAARDEQLGSAESLAATTPNTVLGPHSSTHGGATDVRSIRRRLEIDWQALRDGGLLAPVSDDQLIARQIRDIKRPLVAQAFGRRAGAVAAGNLIVVTSAISGEGKTFIACNLARSMAQERDHTVLLVDADVAKPHTSEMFGLKDEPGLLDLLEHDGLGLNSVIFDTDLPGLSILPAGEPRANATELFASSRMDRLMKQLGTADPNRIVLFDSPPLIQTSESKVLAEIAGQIVFVVGAEKTPKAAVAEAVITLGEEKPVNLVLNKSTSDAIVPRYGSASPYGDFQY